MRRPASLSLVVRLLCGALTLLAEQEAAGPPAFRRERLEAARSALELAAWHLGVWEALDRQRGRA